MTNASCDRDPPPVHMALQKGDFFEEGGRIVCRPWQLICEVCLEPADKFLLVESIPFHCVWKRNRRQSAVHACRFTNVSPVFAIGVMNFQWKAHVSIIPIRKPFIGWILHMNLEVRNT